MRYRGKKRQEEGFLKGLNLGWYAGVRFLAVRRKNFKQVI